MEASFEVITIETGERLSLIDITDQVSAALDRLGVRQGIANVLSLHTTAALFLGEFQGALLEDMKAFLERVVQEGLPYRHNCPECSDCDRANASAHLRGMLLGHTLCLPVAAGRLVLGRFQRVVLAELDGPRHREVRVQALAG